MIRRWIRRLLALPLLTLVLAGPPALLVMTAGVIPHRVPPPEQVRVWLEQPLTPATLAATAWLAGWLLWLLVCGAVAADIARRVRTGTSRLRRLPLPTPLQAAVGGLVGSAIFGAAHGATTHGPGAAPPPAPAPPATPTPTQPGLTVPRPAVADIAGVALPDGSWLPDDLARTITAAASTVWIARRRAYLPGPPTADTPPVAPLPATVRAVETALTDTTPAPGPAPRLLHLPELPRGVLHLAGPGAAAAARGMLLSALIPVGPAPHPTRVIATRDDLHALLGPPGIHDLPGLHTTDDLHDAVTVWQTARRAHDGRPAARNPAPLLLVGARHHQDATTALTQAPHADAQPGTAVLLGGGPGSTRWTVAADGTLAPPAPAGRLCVLTATVTHDLLTLAAHQAPATPDTPPPAASATATPVSAAAVARPAPIAAGRTRLRIGMLGPLTVTADGAPIPIRRSAARQILALLTITPGGMTGHALIEAIWPHLPAHSITGRLYTAVSALRQDLATADLADVIDRHDDRYQLTPGTADSDLWQLEHLTRQATTAIDPHTRTAALTAIATLHTGELAATETWPWLAGHREHVRRRILDACITLAEDSADPHTALRLLQHATDVDPLNRDVHHRATRLLRQTGRHAAADTLTAAYTRRLRDHGLTPPAEVRKP